MQSMQGAKRATVGSTNANDGVLGDAERLVLAGAACQWRSQYPSRWYETVTVLPPTSAHSTGCSVAGAGAGQAGRDLFSDTLARSLSGSQLRRRLDALTCRVSNLGACFKE